jgi:hypothetical protein
MRFPLPSINSNPVGTIECIRSAEQKRDVIVKLSPGKDGVQLLSKSMFIQGAYQLRINWNNNGTNYFHQQVLNINQ